MVNNNLYISILILISIIIYIPSHAEWALYKKAEVTSNEKHKFSIAKNPDGAMYACFILRKETSGAFESRLPVYQIDDHAVSELVGKRIVTTKKGSWVCWQISESKGPLSSDLLEFMNGKTVVFQYYLPDGQIKETTFLLAGVRAAIEEILK